MISMERPVLAVSRVAIAVSLSRLRPRGLDQDPGVPAVGVDCADSEEAPVISALPTVLLSRAKFPFGCGHGWFSFDIVVTLHLRNDPSD